MDNVKNNLLKLKEEISKLDTITDNDVGFLKLIENNLNIEPELYRLLMLLHTNYKSELQATRTLTAKNMCLVIEEIVRLIDIRDNQIARLKENNNNNNNKPTILEIFRELNFIHKTLIFLPVIIFVLWSMYAIAPNAVDKSADLFFKTTTLGLVQQKPEEIRREYDNKVKKEAEDSNSKFINLMVGKKE